MPLDTRLIIGPFIKNHGLFAAGMLCFLFVFLKNAWVSDDAYIAFRSVEQLFAGNGPRWNFDERVQVYTSPLWFVFLCFSKSILSDLFLGSIVLSAACCVAALAIARRLVGDDVRWCSAVLLLLGTWSVMDFTSSGLENPLLYLLVTWFLYHYFEFFRQTEAESRQYHLETLLLSLGLLSVTRHDVATLVLLPSLFVFAHVVRQSGIGLLLRKSYLAWLPLLLWTLFSLVYYGVPFPNTAYAKMMHGISRAELVEFGSLYLQVSLKWDYVAQLVIVLLAVSIAWSRSKPLAWMGAGILLNIFYVMYVGGDFMQGRFLSMALWAAVLSSLAALPLNSLQARGVLAFVLALNLLLSTPWKLPPDSGFDIHEGKRHFSWSGILNERNFYFKTNSLYAWWTRDRNGIFPDHKWCHMGRRAHLNDREVSDFGGIGMYGYCAGLELVVIDRLALGEPFLARLPKPPRRDWRAGHFYRDYPRGFYESRATGSNLLVEPHLAALWNDVFLMTRAPLWSSARWAAIWRINTGQHRQIGPWYLADIEQKNTP